MRTLIHIYPFETGHRRTGILLLVGAPGPARFPSAESSRCGPLIGPFGGYDRPASR
jgi:hypothetical protein